ncbi:MAG: hypothetical protein GEV06_19755 [Luteitalea sp.]|nr:hypothetical protein [Luteitalea sp.]
MLSVAAPIAAIPFTGGASALALGAGAAGTGAKILSGIGKAGDVLGSVGNVAGNTAAGQAQGRETEALLNLSRDRTAADIYGTQQNARFTAEDMARSAPTQDAKQAAYGDALANVQDVNISAPSGIPMGQISGGLRPSLFGAETRGIGQNLVQDAVKRRLAGSTASDYLIDAPSLTPIPDAGGMEKTMGTVGTIGNIIGAVGEGLKGRQQDRQESLPDQRYLQPWQRPELTAGQINRQPGLQAPLPNTADPRLLAGLIDPRLRGVQ